MRLKDLPVCKTCKNKSPLPCKVCGKNRDRVLFEMANLKEKREFYQRVHTLMVRFRMESTGSSTLDLEVLDNCGPWLPSLPKQNPLYDFYERLKQSTVLELYHLFKFVGGNRTEFVKNYDCYLRSKQAEIERIIKENELVFI